MAAGMGREAGSMCRADAQEVTPSAFPRKGPRGRLIAERLLNTNGIGVMPKPLHSLPMWDMEYARRALAYILKYGENL